MYVFLRVLSLERRVADRFLFSDSPNNAHDEYSKDKDELMTDVSDSISNVSNLIDS